MNERSSPEGTHRIRQQQWRLTTQSEAEALHIRKLLRDNFQSQFSAVFNDVFDQFEKSGSPVIHIEKLELDLGIVHSDDLIASLREAIKQKLSEQLEPLKGVGQFQVSLPEGWKLQDADGATFDILLHYLLEGTLPWQATHLSVEEADGQLKQDCMLYRNEIIRFCRYSSPSAIFFFRLLQLISLQERPLMIRDILNLSDVSSFAQEQISGALIKMNTDPYGTLKTVAEDLARCYALSSKTTEDEPDSYHRSTVAQMVGKVSSGDMKEQEPFSVKAFSMSSFSERDQLKSQKGVAAELPEEASERLNRGDSVQECRIEPVAECSLNQMIVAVEIPEEVTEKMNRNHSLHQSQKVVVAEFPVELADGTKRIDNIAVEIDSDNERVENKTGKSWKYSDSSNDKNATNPHERRVLRTVYHAGIILLHPFFSRYFMNTGVIRSVDQNSLSPESTLKAAALLGYLVTGRENLYEYELGVIKVLVGLAPENPLMLSGGLLELHELQEADTLLRSAIEYWSVLKNTSPEGLRSSFLQRHGLLSENEESWMLNIERSGYDILLEKIPWSISFCRFPWMTKPIQIQW